ncbi:hypothetical protein OROMI_024503 [Orobanche minor]
MPSKEIIKIRDGTPLEAEGILTYRKSPRNCSVWHFSSKLDVPSNVVQKKRVARILVFKIRSSQEILKIRDGTPLKAEGILTYRKSPRNCSVWHFSSKLYVPSNVLKKKRVARILVFKIRPSKEIIKIRDGTPLEAEGILTYRKSPRNCSVWHFSKIIKIRDGTPLEAGGILTYRKSPRNCSVWHFSSKLDVPSNVVQKKRVARILVFKIRSSQEILKIRDGTPLKAEGILTYRKSPRNCSVWHFSSKLYVPSNVLKKKRVARILVFKIRPSQEILKIRDDVPSNIVQKKRVARILVFKIRPSQEIIEIRDGTPLEAEGILTYRKRPSKEILKIRDDVPKIIEIRDGTPLESHLKEF